MPKKYCGACGFANEYSFNAPRFCGGCGDGLDGQVKASIQDPKPKLKKRVIIVEENGNEYEEEETGEFVAPKTISMEFEFDGPPKMTLGKVFNDFESSNKGRRLSKKEKEERVKGIRHRLQNVVDPNEEQE